jgi:hypothetical protein
MSGLKTFTPKECWLEFSTLSFSEFNFFKKWLNSGIDVMLVVVVVLLRV